MSDIRDSYTENGRKNMNPSIKKDLLNILTELLRERIRRNHLPLSIEIAILAEWNQYENNWKVIDFEYNHILFTKARDIMIEFKMNQRLIERMTIWIEFSSKNKLTWHNFNTNSIEYITWHPFVFEYLGSQKKWNINSQEDYDEYFTMLENGIQGIWRVELSKYNRESDMIDTYDYYHLEIGKERQFLIRYSNFLKVARKLRLFLNELIRLFKYGSDNIFKVMKYSIIFITTEEQERDEIYFHVPYKVMKWLKMRDIEYRDEMLNRINDEKDNWYREDNWEHEGHIYIDKIFWIDFFLLEKSLIMLDHIILNEDRIFTSKEWYFKTKEKLIQSINDKKEILLPFKDKRYTTLEDLKKSYNGI